MARIGPGHLCVRDIRRASEVVQDDFRYDLEGFAFLQELGSSWSSDSADHCAAESLADLIALWSAVCGHPAGLGQANAVAPQEHPAPVNRKSNSLFRDVVEVGRQYPPTRLPIRRKEHAPVSLILTLGVGKITSAQLTRA